MSENIENARNELADWTQRFANPNEQLAEGGGGECSTASFRQLLATANMLDAEIKSLRRELDAVKRERNALVGTLNGLGREHGLALKYGDDMKAALAARDAALVEMRGALDDLVGEQSQCSADKSPLWCSAHQSKHCEMDAIVAKARAALQNPIATQAHEHVALMRAVCERLFAVKKSHENYKTVVYAFNKWMDENMRGEVTPPWTATPEMEAGIKAATDAECEADKALDAALSALRTFEEKSHGG